MKRVLTFLLLFNLFTTLGAQISIKESPPSFTHTVTMQTPAIQMKTLDLQPYLLQDKLDIDKDIPFRFGIAIDVDYNLNNSGHWQRLPDGGRLWTLKIISPQALTLNLLYDRFKIPPKAKFFVYNEDHSVIQGAFTAENNKKDLRFATAPTKGSSCILEYYEPASSAGEGKISISRVVHGYKNIFFDKSGGFGKSGACNININCPEGDEWQNEKRAVALVITDGGTRLCSGTLINNTEEDLKQYFLTANHCLGGENSFIFMFNYESPDCENTDGPTWQTVQGAILRATNKPSDFALLELTEQIPQSYNVYFAGWSAIDSAASASVCIHHPSGDIKKISFDFDSTISSDYENTPILEDGYWKIASWDLGTTEGGSSGAPLFEQNHHIIGQLKGGKASCSRDSADYFGKFSVSWDYYADSSANLNYWLDPSQTMVKSIEGIDMNSITISHTPLKDTENISSPYTVKAEISTTRPPLKDVYLIWGYDGSVIDSLEMIEVSSNIYEAQIPPGADLTMSYFISARDENPFAMNNPIDAPDSLYSFYAGQDTVKPTIIHQMLCDKMISELPLTISAQVTDNIEVDTVLFIYKINRSNPDTLIMSPFENNYYRVSFPPQNTDLNVNDSIFYHLYAHDNAEVPNISLKPQTGNYEFKILTDNNLISGHVSLSDSGSLKDISLFLSGEMQDTTYTDSGGYYQFGNLTDGTYEITAHKNGYFSLDSLINNIEVNQDTIDNINFRLSPIALCSINGYVNLENSTDSSGVIISISGQGLKDTSDTDGTFSFTKVHPGKVSILFEKIGYISDRIDTLLNNGDTLSALNMTLVQNIRPQNFHVVDAVDSVHLAWDDITKNIKVSAKDSDLQISYFKNLLLNAEYYRIYRSSDSLHFTIKKDSINSLNYTDGDVQISEKYYYFIRAHYDGHWSENSDTIHAVVESSAGCKTLIYDEGKAVSGYFWSSAGAGSGCRMSPQHNVKIISAKYYLLSPVKGVNNFMAKIYDYNGDKPGQMLAEKSVTQAKSNQWNEIDFSDQNIHIDHDFIIFMEYDGTNQPTFAYDSVDNTRSWDYNPKNGAWMRGNQTYLMRANVLMITALDENNSNSSPTEFSLSQNYPNPFNPTTTINYELPVTDEVNLTIYNFLGQRVKTLVKRKQEIGKYSVKWNGKNENRQSVASGIYILQFKSKKYTQVRKMLLIR